MNKTIRFGMIGCGAVTEVKSAPAYKLVEGVKIVAVTRRDIAKAEDYAKRHNIEHVFADVDSLINSDHIDAVYIATPPDSHKELALKVAKAGKACCIEKPLAPSFADSQQIVNTFEQANLPLYVAYYRRSLPRFRKVKKLIEQGDIGTIRHVNWHLSKNASELDKSGDYNWRTDSDVAPGGYFDDLASHGLDLFAYLFGNYTHVKGIADNQQGLYSAFDAISACWQHEGGITGTGSWNFGCFSRADTVTIYGSAGELSFSVFDESPIVVTSAAGVQQFAIEHPENVQFYHVINMANSLHKGTPHPSTGESAAHTSWVMDKILAAID